MSTADNHDPYQKYLRALLWPQQLSLSFCDHWHSRRQVKKQTKAMNEYRQGCESGRAHDNVSPPDILDIQQTLTYYRLMSLPPVAQPSLTMEVVFEAYRENLEEIETHIRRNLDSEAPLINEIASHILNGGGKRIRPLLLTLCARLNGYTPKEDLVLGSLIEFIHTATLLHDDVLDEANLRRGQQTARCIWGNHASILVGDYLYSRAMQQIAAFQNHNVNDVMAMACRKMAEGEILQLCANRQPVLQEADYLRIVEYKTGALVAAACKVGAIISGTSPVQQQGLYQFGLYLGIAFQLADDRLDYTADRENVGKTLGQDFMQPAWVTESSFPR